MQNISSSVSPNSQSLKKNYSTMQLKIDELNKNIQLASWQGDQNYCAKHTAKGKLLARSQYLCFLIQVVHFWN